MGFIDTEDKFAHLSGSIRQLLEKAEEDEKVKKVKIEEEKAAKSDLQQKPLQ